MWEVRVVVGFDPGRARSIQRSFTVHGDADLAGQARRELVAEYGSTCADMRHAAPAVTVGNCWMAISVALSSGNRPRWPRTATSSGPGSVTRGAAAACGH